MVQKKNMPSPGGPPLLIHVSSWYGVDVLTGLQLERWRMKRLRTGWGMSLLKQGRWCCCSTEHPYQHWHLGLTQFVGSRCRR